MGICFSDGPSQPIQYAPTTVVRTYPGCKSCGGWIKQSGLDYCETCLQRNAMKVITPSAPPMQQYQYQQQYPQYTYAVQQQPTYYPQQQPVSYVNVPYVPQQYPPPQRQQMGPATAIGVGFLTGAIMEDMLDPN